MNPTEPPTIEELTQALSQMSAKQEELYTLLQQQFQSYKNLEQRLSQVQQQPVPQVQNFSSSNLSPVVNQVLPMKIPAPETFEGRRDATAVDTWIFQLIQYFQLYPTLQESQKVQYATTLLRKDAAIWWRSYSQGVLAGTHSDVSMSFE